MSRPATMRAAWRDRYVPLDQLEVREIPRPEPGPRDLLIRVHATTVNRTDCAVVTGKPYAMRLFVGLLRPRSPVPGTDFAGVVEAVGAGVRRFAPGDRVWGFEDNGLSSQAEYLTLAENKPVLKIPEGLSFQQAAASAEGAHYAINFINKVPLKPGQRVMLNGATGAIGSAALQLLVHQGLLVTATCRGEDAERVRGLGAERVIDYESEDFTQDPHTYDFVFDAVGKSTFGRCKRLLHSQGVYISSELGPGWENPILALYTPWLGGKRVIFPAPTNIKGSLAHIRKLMQEGHFRPLIDRAYPLERVAEAYAYVASGQKKGNVVLLLA